jgi:hypothetical protein
MKGIRFYLEYPNKTEKHKATVKNLGNHSGNCIALFLGKEHRNPDYSQECLSAVFDRPNSDTNFGAVSLEYLNEKCKRIPARLVKDIHPMLWNRIIQQD